MTRKCNYRAGITAEEPRAKSPSINDRKRPVRRECKACVKREVRKNRWPNRPSRDREIPGKKPEFKMPEKLSKLKVNDREQRACYQNCGMHVEPFSNRG